MRAVSPDVGHPEKIIAENQTEYMPLPVAFVPSNMGMMLLTRWRLNPEERAAIARGEDLYVGQLNFGSPMTPIVVSVGYP